MLAAAMRRLSSWWFVAAGLSVAAIYTVAPLTVCVVAVAVAALPLCVGDLPRHERRWVTMIVVAALIARLVGIAGIFIRNLPNHDDQFVGATAGDEAYAMSRALRMRDILRGSPTTKYDYFVAFDEYGRNRYVTALTATQVIFGPTPYAVRLLNASLFMVGALLLYRLCREAFGAVSAGGGLVAVLFWPTLFAWSISLLKESLYFFLGVVVLTGAVAMVRRPRWRSRATAALVVCASMAVVHDLRPGAVALIGSGLAIGGAAYLVSASKRMLVTAAVAALALAVALSRPAVESLVIQRLEAAAKTHTGHVFTIGHDYKLLDAGFYRNPGTPASSTLTLTRDEAARFVVRAVASFFTVPLPWQLQSTRELAYLPEQLAWYALVALLPVGIVAGYRRDRLVTCMLVGYAVPTSAALALTNGNVGTLLRLRGLVIPYLIWISVVGFCTMLGTIGREPRMPLIDKEGRLFGRLNLFDAAIAAFVIVLIPIAYGTFLLFRTPAPRISSVTRVPITREERRVTGGSRLTAKLKVRGSGLRPMLRASIGGTQTLGFVFEDPNAADVLVGEIPAGTHDLVLYDGVQEVARMPKSVVVEPVAPLRVAGVGALIHLDKAAADALKPGALFLGGPQDAIAKLGTTRQEPSGLWQRPAEILLQCDPDPNDEGCAVGGVALGAGPLPIVKVTGGAGAVLSFALSEVFPTAAPASVTGVVRFSSEPELLNAVRVGDRDDCLDDRAAVVVAVGGRRGGAGAKDLDVTLRVGVDEGPDGWRYRGRAFKAGAPFALATERYVLQGTVLSVGSRDAGGSK
jgi:hypothetical protein